VGRRDPGRHRLATAPPFLKLVGARPVRENW
jgi:hypothetical protein